MADDQTVDVDELVTQEPTAQLGDIVLYHARTLRKPQTALVINTDTTRQVLTLITWKRSGRPFPAFDVTPEPTTPVQHFWTKRPTDVEEQKGGDDGHE